MAAVSPLKLRIEGMDCGACALKIENAMKRLPGVSDIDVSYSLQSLSLSLDDDRTSRALIEAKIKALGFTPVAPPGRGMPAHADLDSTTEGAAWWTSRKGRLVIVTGALLALATIISHFERGWSTVVFIAVALVGLVPIGRRAVASAFSGTPFSIEMLMSVAAVGAIAIGDAGEAAVFIFLFAVGELLEGVASVRARAGIKALIDVVPRTAQRVRGASVETVPVEALLVGDLVVIRPGDRVPSDELIVDGLSELNEAPVTGESTPVSKGPGATVHAGSINANGELRVEITRTAADNTIARIIHMVEEAQASKAPTARFIDRFSRWYTPAAMIVAGLIMLVPPLGFGMDWTTWIYRGLAVLLVACPCALVISTPAAIASGLASGARRGLLIKGGAALETLGKVRTVAFDKTGTLTMGRPQVTNVVPVEGSETDVLIKAAAVERGSSHPLGLAIVALAEARGLDFPKVFGGSIATPGKAVTGRLRTGFVSVGSPRHAAEQGHVPDAVRKRIEALEAEGKTVVVVSESKMLVGLIALRDEPRPDAGTGLVLLRKLGIQPVMLTGDNARTAAAIADPLGLEARAELLPDAKLRCHRLISSLGADRDGRRRHQRCASARGGVRRDRHGGRNRRCAGNRGRSALEGSCHRRRRTRGAIARNPFGHLAEYRVGSWAEERAPDHDPGRGHAPLDGYSRGYGRHGARYGQCAAAPTLQSEGIAVCRRSEGQLACRPSPRHQPLFDGAGVPFGFGFMDSIMLLQFSSMRDIACCISGFIIMPGFIIPPLSMPCGIMPFC